MAMDAGAILLTFPAQGQAVDTGFAGDLVDTTTTQFFIAPIPLDVVEFGVIITTATGADTLAFTAATAPNVAGSYTVKATCTGPAATVIAAGSRLRKITNFRANAGDIIRIAVTDAAASGLGTFYVLAYPAGDSGTGGEIINSTT